MLLPFRFGGSQSLVDASEMWVSAYLIFPYFVSESVPYKS